MKIEQSKLVKKIGNVMKAVATRPTLPVIAYIKLEAEDYTLTMTGTDLEKAFTEQLTIASDEVWSCCVPGRFFTDLIGTMDGEIELTFNDDILTITHNNDDSEVRTMPTKEFPVVGELPNTKSITIASSELAYIIQNTYFSCATDEARVIITGVHFDFQDKIKACGADGFRLAYIEYPLSIDMPSVTIPVKFLAGSNGILGILNDANCDVDIYTTDTQIIFALPESTFTSQLIVGNYPDVNILINQPKPFNVTATIKKKPFLKAIKKLKIYAKESNNLIVLEYQDDCVMLYADGGEQGHSDSKIEAKVDGEHYKTAFNVEFMIDALMTVDNDFCISQGGNHKPIAVYTVGKENEHINTIAPMAVKNNT